MPNAPLKHVDGSTVTTVVDPRFGTADTPTQPAGWGGGTGGGTTSPAPLTGDTYTAPGVYIPAGALDVWRTARDASGTDLVEVAIFGDSITYGAADPNRGPDYYTWVQATREAAWADGHPNGGFGYVHRGDVGGTFVYPAGFAPVTNRVGNWSEVVANASRAPFINTSGTTTDYITFTGTGTGIRLTFLGSGAMGKAAYSVDGGPETVIDNYGGGARVPYEAKPVFIGGLTDGEHSITIRPAGGADADSAAVTVEFHIEFVRGNGLVFHRNGMSGATISHHFRADTNEAVTESMTPFWMGQQSLNTAGSITNARYEGTIPGPKPAYRNVRLAIVQFSTNDLGGVDYTSHDAFAQTMENFAYFASTCRAVGCSGLIVAPPWTQLPINGSRGARRAKAMFASLATAFNIAFADFQEPLGYDLINWSTRNNATAGTGGSHLSADAYEIEGTWLWENVLSL